jgi:hypothetical protein
VTSTRTEATAAARIGAGLALRKRAELLALLRPCFARTGPWLQAGKYAAAVMSELPERNGWSIARHAGDRTPDKPQRLLSHAVWDTFAAMGVVRRFAVAGGALGKPGITPPGGAGHGALAGGHPGHKGQAGTTARQGYGRPPHVKPGSHGTQTVTAGHTRN